MYRVSPLASASLAADLMCSGVSKSGSSAPRSTMSRPLARSSAARDEVANIGEGAIRRDRSEVIHFKQFVPRIRRCLDSWLDNQESFVPIPEFLSLRPEGAAFVKNPATIRIAGPGIETAWGSETWEL